MWNNELIHIDESIYDALLFKNDETFQLNGNHLFVLTLLKANIEGYTIQNLLEMSTYEGKLCINKVDVTVALDDLVQHKYIAVVNDNEQESNIYMPNMIVDDESRGIDIPMEIINKVIQGVINYNDFRLYCFIKLKYAKNIELNYNMLHKELNVDCIYLNLSALMDEKLIVPRFETDVVYRMYDDVEDILLYIGMTNNIKNRVKQHSKTQPWWQYVTRIEYSQALTRNESRIYEVYYISKLHPMHNTQCIWDGDVNLVLPELQFYKYSYDEDKYKVMY